MKLSIILPTWNNSWWTVQAVRAVRERTRLPYEIIWIDNGSTDEEHIAALAEFQRKPDYVSERYARPLGFPRAINAGLRRATGSHIALLNNDVQVLPDWDTELVAAVEKGGGAAGPVAIQPAGWQAIQEHPWLGIPPGSDAWAVHTYLRRYWAGKFREVPERPEDPRWRPILAFFCTVLPLSVVQQVGMLDEQFGWGFGDDDDYAIRLRRAGYKLWLCPGAVVCHALSQTISKAPGGVHRLMREAWAKLRAKWPFGR